MENTEKQIALVTGASRGIGRAIAVALAKSARHVIINYCSRKDAAEEALHLVEAAGGSGEFMQFDVADTPAVDAAIDMILKKHGRVDVLVNNAGIRNDMLMVWMQPDDWRKVIETDLTGFYNVSRFLVKEMVLRRSGRIVNITSAAGLQGMPGQVNYSAAKAGLIGATQALAKEVAKRNVTVNAVAPGFIDTDMMADLPKKEISKTIPVGRLGSPEDVAAVVLFLCSAEASYITGQVICVNGGIF